MKCVCLCVCVSVLWLGVREYEMSAVCGKFMDQTSELNGQ